MTIRRTLPLTVAGTSLALLVTATGAVPALADTTPSPSPTGSSAQTCIPARLSYVRARVDAAVQARELTISQLTRVLAARTHITDGHRATLSSTYTADASGLRTVDAKVQADTACAQAVTDGRTVVTSFRVYLLLVPQTHLAAAADTGSYAAGQLAAVEPKAQAAIDALTDPTTKAAAQAKLDDLKTRVGAAQSNLAGVADGALSLVPADIPAAEPTLAGYRAKVVSAHAALTQAVADAKALRSLLGNA